MDTAMLVELIGYLGSLLVIISMLMASVVKLRLINTAGSVVSIVYAAIIGTYPVVIMNIALLIINIYNLFKLFKPEKHFDLIASKTDDAFLLYFLRRWKEDIKLHFPEFDRKAMDAETAFLVCCNGEPAGVLLGRKSEDGTLDIALDYSTPTYRDCSVAQYLHAKLPANGFHTLLSSQSKTKGHISYLTKMGFTETKGVYMKKLSADPTER